MALRSARLCHCCHSRIGTTRFPVLQPTHTPRKGRCASQVTLSHNPSLPLTDTWPPWHQTPGEPKGFGGWCVSAARSASLLSGARCRNVSRCKPHHHLHSRPGGEISARHGARPRELICQCDTLALASHWSVDHVTGSDWWRVTSGQLHQIWPGCSWASSSSSTLCSPLLLQDSTTISLAAPSH